MLDGFAKFAVKKGCMASRTVGLIGVVAALSRYIIFSTSFRGNGGGVIWLASLEIAGQDCVRRFAKQRALCTLQRTLSPQ